MTKSNERKLGADEHQRRLETVKEAAMSLPVSAVREPDMPVAVFIDEGHVAVAAAHEHQKDLTAVGLPTTTVEQLHGRLEALASAEALWRLERGYGRNEETRTVIDDATALREDVLAAADLALRKSAEGQRRLSQIREGEGLPDLVADLTDLAVLVGHASARFEAIRYPVSDKAAELTRMATALQATLANEDAGKTLGTAKELRDRVYTLALEPLTDLRAHATFAFRHDRSNNRRMGFTSAYHRTRQARRRQAKITATPSDE